MWQIATFTIFQKGLFHTLKTLALPSGQITTGQITTGQITTGQITTGQYL